MREERLTPRVARRKTADFQKMAEALLKVIESGFLFKAFMNAGERLKLSKDMNDKLNKAYG